MSSFDLAIPTIIKHEGGFVDHPKDPGGATNWGVSLRYLRSLGHIGDFDSDGDIDADDIRQMPKEFALKLYREQWWDKNHYFRIVDQALATKVFDLAINMGSKQAHKLLQRACWMLGQKITDDGVLGNISFKAINALDAKKLLIEFKRLAIQFYKLLNKPEFIKGWLARVKD